MNNRDQDIPLYTQYEILPHADVLYTDATNDNGLNTIESVAKFVRSMVEDRADIYMPGITDALQNIAISQGQLGLLEKYSSPLLSAKLSHYLADDDLADVVSLLEHAFWNPLVSAADKILEANGDTPQEKLTRQYATVKLYAGMSAAIGNMRVIMRSAGASGADPDITRTQKPPLRNEFETYTRMPAEQVLHVMKRGILPQISYAAHVELGLGPEKMKKFQDAVYKVWRDDPKSLSAVHLIRPIDPVEWMKYGRLADDDIYKELRQAQTDYSGLRLLPPPD